MKYLREKDGNIRFNAVGFLKDYAYNCRVLQTLRDSLQLAEDYGPVCMMEGDRVQTSNISDMTANLAIYTVRLKDQIKLYEFWLARGMDAMSKLTEDEKTILQIFFLDGFGTPLRRAMETFHMEKTSIYRIRKQAIDHFSILMIGDL